MHESSRRDEAPAGPGGALKIVGSGPVALAFALFTLRQGIPRADIALERFDAPPPPALAGRQLAMSAGSWQLLSRIARPARAAPIETVDVSILGHPGRTRITAREMKVPALGYVLRYGELLAVLQTAATEAGLGNGDGFDATEVLDRDGRPLLPAAGNVARTIITVHAEGDTGEDAERREFGQSALLAEVEADRPGHSEAFECFTADGPLALLPLPEPRRYSLVWCATHQQTGRRATLTPTALSSELQHAFGWALGRLAVVTPLLVAPMIRRRRRRTVDGTEVWIGNAAQALHPVAGQGLNLGLRDAFGLASLLGQTRARRESFGVALARYERARRGDRTGTIGLTDLLAGGFRFGPLRPLQSAALAMLDTTPTIRSMLARRLMYGLRG
jgi:2-octaprenyl-6-methoxyphenol hydroxylase